MAINQGYQENYPHVFMHDYGFGPFQQLYYSEKEVSADLRWTGIRGGKKNTNILIKFKPSEVLP